MARVRSDLGAGLIVSLALHALVLAAAGVGLPPEEPVRTAPLDAGDTEVIFVDATEWSAQLEPSSRTSAAQPRELPRPHGRSSMAAPLPSPFQRTPVTALEPPLPVVARPAMPSRTRPPARANERLAAQPVAERPPARAGSASRAEPAVQQAVASSTPRRVEDAALRVRHEPPRVYPPAARRKGIEGTATVGLSVLRDGRVERVWLIASAGSSVLDRAAQEYVRAWVFEADSLPSGELRFRKDVRYVLR